MLLCVVFFFFQAEDGIRDLVRSRGLGDVYKRQLQGVSIMDTHPGRYWHALDDGRIQCDLCPRDCRLCLLYTSDAADERSSVDLGGRRIIKKNKR